MRRLRGLCLLVVGLLLAAACSSSGSGGGHAAPSGVLTISNESGGLWTCGFNPFNPNVNFLSFGNVYEPLAFVNSMQSGKASPWLASSWSWSNGNKVLTFTIRHGVKFSDGTPMTAADVAFTFNLLHKFPGLDLNSVWSVLSSVVQQGDKVVMTFKSPAVPYFFFIADQVGIVPQAIWSKLKNPVNYNDPHPVGTGAYVVNPCTAQNVTYTANRHYWQPGEPKVAKVLYPAFTSNDPANTYLATGRAQWGGQFIPNIKTFYTSKSSNYHYWFPPTTNVSIFINLTVSPLNNVKVRQAMAYAINRSRVAQIGEYGYEPAGNQTGIVTPTFSSWLDTAAAAKYGNYAYNPAKAEQLLRSAGFHKGSDGIYVSPSGQKLSFSMINIGGYSDWVASAQVVQQELKAVGIQITPQNLSSNDYDTRTYDGNYQLAYDGNEGGGPSPYYEMRQELYSGNTAPIGKAASSNWERYRNAQTDALLNAFGTTTSAARQHQIIDQLEQVMLSQVPIIPVTEAVDFYQYDTGTFSGWPTPSNPYAQPPPWVNPDMGWVLLHLKPK
jgi:peptide/nickel transport system substrate-binding protein